ncbi:Hsp70 family protein [Actinophytocola sp.]|uniref:Hsp70 family protein n=1 Tax=Actinophytocola sp. TaxID=1872138 RepID=UPI002D6DF4EC|nr:Hsp70 family protein [Actinophytocola sp.]HYQ68394.1 Hsp70 family protein [Actinophytocola sp.]
MAVLSVDLGTSNTVAVLSAHGRPPRVVEVDGSATMPSALFAADDGNLVIGRDAERRARLDPARFEPNPKRRIDDGTLLLGDVVVPVTEALGAVLRRVYDETSRQLGGAQPDEVRLTHPAQWGPVRRNVLLAAARLAGMGTNLVLVPEPVAAAAHFASFPGQQLGPGQALAVYDLGAGTFDVAIVAATQNGYTVLAEAGLSDLGGLDVDQALLEHVGRQVSIRDPSRWQRILRPESTADRRARRAMAEDVKAAKEALSRHPQTEVPLPEPFEDVLVTRVELEALIRPSMLRSVELLASTIRSTGMTPDRLVGIYLVGGSSRIPLIATLIAENMRVVPSSLDQPETAVALGAHHITPEGVSLRTANIGSAQAPPTGGFHPQGQQSGPMPVAQPMRPPQTGPNPVASPPMGNPVAVPPIGGPMASPVGSPVLGPPSSTFPTQAPPGSPATRPGSGLRKALLGVVAVVVLAVVAVGAVFLLRPSSDLPTADSCQQKGDTDGDGFTACLRQLAGTVVDSGGCKPAERDTNADVMCSLRDSYQVMYAHVASVQDAQKLANTELADMTEGDHVEAEWKGNGLDGRWRAGVNGGTGVLVFTVKDRPLVGWLTRTELRGADDFTPDTLGDFFAENVQPGT